MKIKVKLYEGATLPSTISKGDWIDLYIPQDLNLRGPIAKTLKRKTKDGVEEDRFRKVVFDHDIIPLNIAMKLPKGYEAVINPRSSTFIKWGIMMGNHQGVIDNNFGGNEDIWCLSIVPFKEIFVPKGTRLAQFRIQLSQKATIWQKIKWLFSNGKIEFVKVDDLETSNRGGFGSTGI